LEKVIGNQKKAAAESEVDKEEKSNDIENKNETMVIIEERQEKTPAPSEKAPDVKRDTSVEARAIDNGEDAIDQRGDASSQNGDIVDYEGEP
jgi:hypothetical protein